MDDKQMLEIVDQLKKINENLSILIALQKSNKNHINISKEEKNILSLCNGKNSIEDIVIKTNKTRNNVKVTLTHLRKKGLIKSKKVKSKLVYTKI